MREFYRSCHHFVLASTALTATSAFVAMFSGAPSIAQWLTAVVALASTLDLVFSFSERANQHDQLRRRFTELAARIATWAPIEENLALAHAERLRIEMDEVAERRLVDIQAENDEARARGVDPKNLAPLSLPQRWFGYVATFGMSRLEEWHKLQAESKKNDSLQASA
jgi:hypothetical protein